MKIGGGPGLRGVRWLVPPFLSALSACGGGSSPAMSPPTALSYTQPAVFTVGQPITPLSPTVTGRVSSYAISPTLPAGISLNTTTGVISGTPSSAKPSTTYMVTASNAVGSTTAILSITVNAVAPSFSYVSSYYSFTAGVPAQTVIPMLAGGGVVSWTVSPALPAGLTLGVGG